MKTLLKTLLAAFLCLCLPSLSHSQDDSIESLKRTVELLVKKNEELEQRVKKLEAANEGRSSPISFVFRYGGGTPSDSGPLGHCEASIRSTGSIRILSNRRSARAGGSNRSNRKVLVYESDPCSEEQLKRLQDAAFKALAEPKYTRVGECSDCNFLELSGPNYSSVAHRDLWKYDLAPPGMIEFIRVYNELLPEKERIPLDKNR